MAQIRALLADIPQQSIADGRRVQWGAQGNKARALHLAARLGHVYEKDCTSCESDLLALLRYTAK